MSWSFSFKGPALDVAKAAEMYLEKSKMQDDVEEQIRCRFVHMLVVTCHGMKDKSVTATGNGHMSPLGHTVNIMISPMATEPVVEPKQEETKAVKAKGKS